MEPPKIFEDGELVLLRSTKTVMRVYKSFVCSCNRCLGYKRIYRLRNEHGSVTHACVESDDIAPLVSSRLIDSRR